MMSNKNQPSKLSFFFSVCLFIIGMTLFFSKLDSRENKVKPIQYTGLICILSSSFSIVVGLITWICQSPFATDKMVQAYTTSNKELTSPSSGSENEIDTSILKNENAIKSSSNQLTKKSYSAPVTRQFPKQSSDENNELHSNKNVNYTTISKSPISSNI